MADVELAVRYLAFQDPDSDYRGNLKEFLDKYCIAQNKKFDEADLLRRLENFNQSISAARQVFGARSVCRKWVPDLNEFDTRFNRAIFDIIIGSFSNADFRKWAIKNKAAVVDKFKELCSVDTRFLSSLETTTKSTNATKIRFTRWYEAVSEMSGINFTAPKIGS